MSDGRKNNGGARPNSGQKKKNNNTRRITFNPSQDVLDIWDSWDNKTVNVENAIRQFNEQ